MNPPIRIAVTPGEPSGVGPELTLKLAQKSLPFEIVAIANFNLLDYVSKKLGLDIKLNHFKFNSTSHSHAITTGPVQKSIINEAGIHFSGHTEYFANITGGYPVMMLTDEVSNNPHEHALRVALVTTHIPISDLASQITSERLEKVLTVLHKDLVHKFKISHPRICVCGLNPHAGEGGHLGTEEIAIIQPLIKKLQQSGMNLFGPEPAD